MAGRSLKRQKTNRMIMLNKVKIAWAGKHFGEEPPLVGQRNDADPSTKLGAGGIFFSGCNLHCVFCQNWQISQGGLGKEYSVAELAQIMLKLEKQGAINLDLVTPTIWWRLVKQAIKLAKDKGLKIPVAWNSNGYESVEIIKQLAGLVDIYLPDFKYGDDEAAKKYSKIENYPAVAKLALSEMLKQAGSLEIGADGLAKRGVIVRHLILPGNLENSFKALEIIKNIDKDLPVSLMRQYYPTHQASLYSEINRPVNEQEFKKVFERMIKLGLENGWTQEENCEKVMLPDFTKSEPFKIS